MLQEILKKYPIEPHVGFDGKFKWISPKLAMRRNAALKAAGIKTYTDELGHRWQIEGGGKKEPGGRWRNITGDRRLLERSIDPRTGKPGTKFASLRARVDRRIRDLIESNKTEAEVNKNIRKIIAEFNAKLDPTDKESRLIFEHRISQSDWKKLGLPGNPADSHNIWITTAREAKQKTRIESTIREQGKAQTHYTDYNPETRSFHVLPVDEFNLGKEPIGGFEIPETEWASPDFNPRNTLNTLRSQEVEGFTKTMDHIALEKSLSLKTSEKVNQQALDEALDIKNLLADPEVSRAIGIPNEMHKRNLINSALNKVFTTDPSSELYSMGLWHDGKSLDDSWVKITRELNTDSGTFANGKWTPAPDPTARTNIDILSDIGQGQGEFDDIIDLKNRFHNLKRTLPPGEYYMHADNPTKAKYYQRAFKNDPWVGPSGEQGAGKNKKGIVERYDTLKLTVPDEATQFAQAAEGPYPRWQDQGVPQLDKQVSDIARRTEAQMLADKPVLSAAAEASGGLKKALMKAGTVLPFVGAGLDAWDVTQRYDEMMNNPNEGFADWLDKTQFAIASATLGTSFWAEPANFALGMSNLGIDAMRTIFEEDKREDFGDMLRGVGRGIGHIGRQLL